VTNELIGALDGAAADGITAATALAVVDAFREHPNFMDAIGCMFLVKFFNENSKLNAINT
jgi:hypothetical protein